MSDRRRQIEISANARQDLAAILSWSEERWGAYQQERYEEALLAAVRMVREYPESGRLVKIEDVEYRKLQAGHHVLYYQLLAETV